MSKLKDMWLVWKEELSSSAVNNLQRHCQDYESHIDTLKNRLELYDNVLNRAITKILGHLPRELPEMDPVRKADSDRIGEEAMKRIIGEAKASNQTRGW